MNLSQLEDDHYCIGCGMDNPDGFRIEWKVEGGKSSAEFTPERKHQGWKGIVHGGIVCTLLDEAMTRLAWIVCGGALTAEITVRFIEPAKVGHKLFIAGEIVKENRKLVEMRADLFTDPTRTRRIAWATGKAIKILK